MRAIIKLISSGLGLGFCPIAPGTAGSALGVLIFLLLGKFGVTYIFICIGLVFLGLLVSGRAERVYQEKDSKKIVIDEIAGMCIVFLGMPINLWVVIVGFLFFRIFDIIKPQPAKAAEKLSGSLGIMLDDIICAIYANIVLQVFIRLPLNIAS